MKVKLSGKVYEWLKWLCLIGLPALSSLYFGLAGIWGFPYAEQICGTIALVEAFIGAIIGISTYNYRREVRENGEKDQL